MTHLLSYINEKGHITIFDEDVSHMIAPSHPLYQEIRERCDNNDESVLGLIKDYIKQSESPRAPDTGSVSVSGASVTYNGKTFTNPFMVEIINRLGGIGNDSVRRFVNRITMNPREESVQQLMEFLKHNNLPITEDGFFIGYKAVTHDYRDKQTRSFDCRPGCVVEEPRDEVEHDPDVPCARGHHVGTYEYANGFADYKKGDRLILVAVDPFDVVSVPRDHNHQKLRCCRYTSIGDYKELLDERQIYSVEGLAMCWGDYVSDVREQVEKICQFVYDDEDDNDDWDDLTDCPNCGEDISHWDLTTGNFCPLCGEEL